MRKQTEWYRAMLAELDTADDVRAVILCCHHSPYSDSKLVGSNGEVHPDRGTEVALDPEYDPLFHYLTVRYSDGVLTVDPRTLKPDLSGFETGRTFDLMLDASPGSK